MIKKVLIAGERFGLVRDAFAARGHDATSCDLLPSETPGKHLQCDFREVLHLGWDLLIGFPPCDHLAVSGAKWFEQKRKDGRQQAGIDLFMTLVNAPVDEIAVENPIGIMSTHYRKPDQIIQPWMFGDEFTKTTCLWLKGLPKLTPTNIVGKGETVIHGGKKFQKWYSNRTRNRDKTFPGIAKAMAEQWG